MKSAPPDELLPVIVADLADAGSRDLLEAVASAGGEAYVPLATAPVDGNRHVLEVYTPGAEPLILLALPLGPPTDAGFLLRLAHMAPAPSHPSADVKPPPSGVALRSKSAGAHRITESHAASLRSQAPPADYTGRVLAGKLRIDLLVGTGGMGVVYRATHLGLHIPIAVKVLHAHLQRDLDFCRRFQAEALAASRLDHANLTRVLDFGQEPDGLVYIAMEFLDGVDLRAELTRAGALDLERIVELMAQVCAGLSHVHDRGIVHRDLKPDNLILISGKDDEGRAVEIAKLCDFGIAVARGASAGELVGTPEYMSPEQCAGEDLDARSDLYACGVMLYEMATGRTPFEGQSPTTLINHHMHVAPARPSSIRPVDSRLEAVILKALEKDPAGRYQSARDLRHAVRAVVAAAPSLPQPPAPQRQPPPLPKVRVASPPTPPVRPARPPPARGAMPSWIEPASGTFDSPVAVAAPPPGRALAAKIAADPTRWLAEFAQTTEARRFIEACDELEAAIPVLAEGGRIDVLWRVGSTLAIVAEEGPATRGSRAAAAHHARKALLDPAALAPAADDILHGRPPTREARSLLLDAGVGGAHALYSARARSSPSADLRSRFTTFMRELGAPAVPIVRAALERLEGKPSPATEVAVDVLEVIGGSRDDATGEIVARFLRSPDALVRRAATDAVVRAWGDRARALLTGLLRDSDDGVRLAALAGLRDLGNLEEPVARHIVAIVDPRVAGSTKLKAAAVASLRSAAPNARPAVIRILEQLVVGLPVNRAEDEPVLLEGARCLVALAGRAVASGSVKQRANSVREPLRTTLLGLLAS